LFFCRREAVETVIYLAEMRFSGRTRRLPFRPKLLDEDLARLLRSERPGTDFGLVPNAEFFPTLIDKPANAAPHSLRRLGCKMATAPARPSSCRC